VTAGLLAAASRDHGGARDPNGAEVRAGGVSKSRCTRRARARAAGGENDVIEWSQSLSVGIPSVDEQHQELVRAFNELQAAMREGKGSDKVLPTLRFLGEYALKHFSNEEALMRMHRYDGFDEHRAAHAAFKADFTAILKATEASTHRLALTMDVSRRLLDWLFTHIKKMDKEMGAFLVRKGVR
jgi:hemerythrin